MFARQKRFAHFDGPATISPLASLGGDKIKFMYYVYAIYDRINDRFYIGYTGDLRKRISEHKSGKNLTTRRMSIQELVYYEASISKKDAEAREKQLKTGFGRGYLRKRLKEYLL